MDTIRGVTMSNKCHITWIKPSGVEIVTNDLAANIELAKSLGWVVKSDIDHAEEVVSKPIKRRKKRKPTAGEEP